MPKDMDNVDISVDGSTLTIVVDLSKNFGASASGKSTIVASTRGNKELDAQKGTYFSVNVYRKSK